MKTVQPNRGGEFTYSAPTLEIVEIVLEKGFAASEISGAAGTVDEYGKDSFEDPYGNL